MATNSNYRQATASLTLKLYSGQTELSISNLQKEIEFSFPVNTSDSNTLLVMQEIEQGKRSLAAVECSFFN